MKVSNESIIIHQAGMTLDEMRAEVAALTAETQADYREWLATRPDSVQAVAAKVDIWQIYQIRDGAPYGTTGPGTLGFAIGFTENGQVIFDAHILRVDLRNCRQTPEQVRAVDMPLRVRVAPEWLERFVCTEQEAEA